MITHLQSTTRARAGQRDAPIGTAFLQRKCDKCRKKKPLLQRAAAGPTPETVPPIVHEVLRSPGQPLDTATRAFMEPRFGLDFSRVRVHSDDKSAESARIMDALAYTIGSDIVFGVSQQTIGTSESRRLLAHELTHVVQQRGATSTSTLAVGIDRDTEREAQASRIAGAVMSGKPVAIQANASVVQSRIQRQTEPAKSGISFAGSMAASASSSCLEAIAGEDIESLFEAGAVTIIEFGAEWCGPCQILQNGLEEICLKYREQPPPIPVRFYTVDIEAPGNEKAERRFAADGHVPHLYIFIGSTQKVHINTSLEPDLLQSLVAEQVEYAATSGAVRGAKKGMLWGGIAGGLAGIGGAIALAATSVLTGNWLMLGILGSIVGGAAIGLGLGAGIGAIFGKYGDDRNRGPSQQRRRRLQAKARFNQVDDPLEREADQMAIHVAHDKQSYLPRKSKAKYVSLSPKSEASSRLIQGLGQPLDAASQAYMESLFGRDFSQVRIHQDSNAAKVAQSMNAFAVTSGADIYFAQDGYSPYTSRGRSILAHELAHVVQNDNDKSKSSQACLEMEATKASILASNSQTVKIQHGSKEPVLLLTRGQQTGLGLGLGLLGGGGLGALIGWGIASLIPGASLVAGTLIGLGVGAGLGALIGGLVGYNIRRTKRVETNEAEALIRRGYGKYMGRAAGPLQNANIHIVNQDEMCIWMRCRRPESGDECKRAVGWTDTGPDPAAAQLEAQSSGKSAPKIEGPEDEPICENQRQIEHATPDHPVIYYQQIGDYPGILIHEGLHAYAHPNFPNAFRNFVNEGATDYFTRRIFDDINMPYKSGYDDNVAEVKKLVSLVGEDVLARAYFRGEIDALEHATDRILGPCALIEWALDLQMGSFHRAQEIIDGRNRNYCSSGKATTATLSRIGKKEEVHQS